jgi:NADH:quinone reductase (non-electrogenic)
MLEIEMDTYRCEFTLSGQSSLATRRTGIHGAALSIPRHHVVIVGGGFAGLAAARALAGADADVTLVDRRNHHLFQPLLYQVATAELSPADIAWPIRSLLRRQKNIRSLLAEVDDIDTGRRKVHLCNGGLLHYDTLVLATGARHAYFGRNEWAGTAPGLKEIDDALSIRHRILLAFEKAETAMTEAELQACLTFAVIGAGPTGVEIAGAIADLARRTLRGEFRRFDPSLARVVLLEAGPRVLPGFSEKLSARAQAQLERLGVEVRLGTPMTDCGDDGIVVGAEKIPASTVIWAAGVMASPAGRWLGASTDRAGRVKVMHDLTIHGHPEIFVIGDTASVISGEKPVPGVAPAAKQMGAHVGRLITARLQGRYVRQSFEYRDAGSLATIGRNAAVAQIGRLALWGFPAWLLWAVAHIYFLIGTRSRYVVAINWLWNWLTHMRGSRLITGLLVKGPAMAQPERRDTA